MERGVEDKDAAIHALLKTYDIKCKTFAVKA